MTDHAKNEKLGLLGVVLAIVVSLTWIALYSIRHGINSEAATLVGVIVTGLAAFGKDIVSALRGYTMSAQLSKVTDQLAASGPAAPTTPAPQDAVEAAQDTADAAQDKADAIKTEGS